MGRDTLMEIRIQAHMRACRFRCIDRLVNTPAFKKVAHHEEMKYILEHGRVERLKELMLEEKGLTLYDLKLRAKNLGIKNYSRLGREELEKCLKN